MPALSPRRNTRPAGIKVKRKPVPITPAAVYHAPAPPPTPTRSQIRSSRAQARTYGSQAKQLKTQARRQRAKAHEAHIRDAKTQARYYVSQARQIQTEALRQRYYREVVKPRLAQERYYSSYGRATYGINRSPEELERISLAAGIPGLVGTEATPRIPIPPGNKSGYAPIGWGLRQLLRPGGAVVGAGEAVVGGRNPLSGAAEGFVKPEEHQFSKVALGGWKPDSFLGKTLKFGAGLTGDILTDPLTYGTFGATSVGRVAAARASERTFQSAVRTGLRQYAPDIAAGTMTRREATDRAVANAQVLARSKLARELKKVEGEQRGITYQVRLPGGRIARAQAHKLKRRVTLSRAIKRAEQGQPTGAVKRPRRVKRPVVGPLIRTTAGLKKAHVGVRGARYKLRGQPVPERVPSDLSKAVRNVGASMHAGIRHASVTPAQNAQMKAVVAESLAAGEKLQREGAARANAQFKQLKGDDVERVYHARETGGIRHLHKLADTAEDLEDLSPEALKQVVGAARSGIPHAVRDPEWRRLAQRLSDWPAAERERAIEAATGKRGGVKTLRNLPDIAVEQRAGMSAVLREERGTGIPVQRLGSKSRSEAEISLGARTRPPTKREISAAESNFERAQKRVGSLRDAEARARDALQKGLIKQEQYDEIHQRYLNAGQEAVKAKRQMQSVNRLARTRPITQEKVGAMKTERLKGQAKEYVPRISEEEIESSSRSLVKRLAHPERAHHKGGLGAQKPTHEPATYREHRAPIRTMREEGTPTEQRIAAQTSGDIREVEARRFEKGGAAVRQATLNRKLADTFEQPLPRNFDEQTFEDLREKGLGVYVLKGGELKPLTSKDVPAIKRAAMSSEDRAKIEIAEAAERKYAQAENLPMPKHPERETGRYMVLPKDVVERAYASGDRLGSAPFLDAVDVMQNKWKGVALAYPGYLVRNLGGDAFNAWTDEDLTRMAYNFGRGQRALQAGGKKARALERKDIEARRKALGELAQLKQQDAWLKRQLSPGLRDIQLTAEQANEIAGSSAPRLFNELREGYKQMLRREHPDWSATQINDALKGKKDEIHKLVQDRLTSGKVSSLALAEHAERMGVTGQGRFAEIMQEGRNPAKGRGTRWWKRAVRRVEDSVRITTFIGGIQRGLTSREAASRARQIHFDYNDLTAAEKDIFRRLMPFYTFPSRNIPFQAKQLVTRPGKYAKVEHVRQNVAQAQGVDKEDWEKNLLSDFERKQAPLPVKVGGKVYPVSLASPFTDLNDVISTAGGVSALAQAPGSATGEKALQTMSPGLQRVLEALGPWKTPFIELPQNRSFFFREPIESDNPAQGRLVEAPGWAAKVASVPGVGDEWKSLTGLERKGGKWMWRRRADYAIRSARPGIIGATAELAGLVPGLGQKTSARGRPQWTRVAGIFGPRIGPAANRKLAQQGRNYEAAGEVSARMKDYRDLWENAHGRDWPGAEKIKDPKYQRMLNQHRRLTGKGKTKSGGGASMDELSPADRAEIEREIRRQGGGGSQPTLSPADERELEALIRSGG